MKKQFLFIALLLSATLSFGQSITLAIADDIVPKSWATRTAIFTEEQSEPMPALRVLTDDERQVLATSETFRGRCIWSARNYANFVQGESLVTAASTNAAKIKAVKDLIVAIRVTNGFTHANIVDIYLDAAKGRTFDLGAAPVDETTLLAAFTSTVVEEFNTDYFDVVGFQYHTSID